MVCGTCEKTNRIFVDGALLCPACDGIKPIEKSIALRELNVKLEENRREFNRLIVHSNFHDVLTFALNVRENAARELVNNPNSEEAAMSWLSSLFLLANISGAKSAKAEVRPNEVMTLANETLATLSSIALFEQDKQVFLETGEKCDTELQILFRTPTEIDRKSFEALGFHGLPGSERIIEQMLKANMIEHSDAVESEALSRNLRAHFPKYLLPYKNISRMTAYEEISLTLISLIAIELGPHFSSNNGVLSISLIKYREIEKEAVRKYGNVISDFLSLKDSNHNGDNLALHLFVYESGTSRVYLPYHSLVLMRKIGYKYIFEMKEYRSKVGEEPEDWIYGLMEGYLETFTPKTREKLLRFQIGKDLGEIDVAGFKEKKVVIIESKFWESSNVSEIERELDKFEKRLVVFEKNMDKHGFSKDMEVIPLFYNPWPPFPKYGKSGIIIIPSLSALIWYMISNFAPIVRPYARSSEQIARFLADDTEDRLFMSDLSSHLPVEKDTYRVQDVQVDEIDENEVVAYSFVSMGYAFPFIYDVDGECLSKLKKSGVKKGSVLRVCTYNLRGYWFQIQIVDFRLISLEKPFDPNRVLAELNLGQYDEFLAHIIAGHNGYELRKIAVRYGLNLKKFLDWAEASGHNVYSAAGILLRRASIPGQKLYQCECGEVPSVSQDIYPELVKRYGKGLKCRRCDPMLQNKIEEISGR